VLPIAAFWRILQVSVISDADHMDILQRKAKPAKNMIEGTNCLSTERKSVRKKVIHITLPQSLQRSDGSLNNLLVRRPGGCYQGLPIDYAITDLK
jgi:hypothetical protein